MHIAVWPVHMEQLGFHWTDFCAVTCCGLSFRYVQEVQVCLKSDKNIRHFTWGPLYFIFFIVTYVALEYKGRTFLLGIKLLCGDSVSTKNFIFIGTLFWDHWFGRIFVSLFEFISCMNVFFLSVCNVEVYCVFGCYS